MRLSAEAAIKFREEQQRKQKEKAESVETAAKQVDIILTHITLIAERGGFTFYAEPSVELNDKAFQYLEKSGFSLARNPNGRTVIGW